MGHEATRASIEGRLLTNWTADATNCRTPVQFENVRGLLTKVDGSVTIAKPPQSGSWIRLAIRDYASQQVSIGSTPLIRYPGRIHIQIFVPLDLGTDQARIYADLLNPIFRRKQFSGITTFTDEPQSVGPTEHWWQMNVAYPFKRDEVDS